MQGSLAASYSSFRRLKGLVGRCMNKKSPGIASSSYGSFAGSYISFRLEELFDRRINKSLLADALARVATHSYVGLFQKTQRVDV